MFEQKSKYVYAQYEEDDVSCQMQYNCTER